MYSRISNPTVAAVEEKIAALEGGVGALCTTSGQAATLIAVLNILSAGDHILCSSTIYGGTINLLAVTLKRFGIETSFVDADADEETPQGSDPAQHQGRSLPRPSPTLPSRCSISKRWPASPTPTTFR